MTQCHQLNVHQQCNSAIIFYHTDRIIYPRSKYTNSTRHSQNNRSNTGTTQCPQVYNQINEPRYQQHPPSQHGLTVITVWYTQQEAYDQTGVHHTHIVTLQDTAPKTHETRRPTQGFIALHTHVPPSYTYNSILWLKPPLHTPKLTYNRFHTHDFISPPQETSSKATKTRCPRREETTRQ